MAEDRSSLIVVVGPTASGKSVLAARLARRLDGEIVGVDSAQVYRGLDAATAKPPRSLREEIPHHLIDVADPSCDFSAGDFARLAEAAIARIRSSGRRAVLVGGTGLYLTALLRGLAEMPPRDTALRAALLRREAARGEGSLHRMLASLDPDTAGRLAPRDRQRIVRALEVALRTGRPLSALITRRPFAAERYACVKVGLTMPRPALAARIDARVEAFFDAGLVEEARRLLDAGVPRTANCLKALGYREAVAHLSGGMTLAETVDLVKRNTRRYSKRQLTWFRREPGVIWFETGERPEERFADIESEVALRLGAPRESRDGNR